jgi:hypothetical protein
MEVTGQRVVAELVHRIPERLTIYNSPDDAAIGPAAWLFGSVRRLGRFAMDFISGSGTRLVEYYGRLPIFP